MTYFILAISVLSATCGQVLFKLGMNQIGGLALDKGTNILATIVKILTNFTVLTGLFFYGVSTLLWLFSLSKLPLNYAYPFTALTLVLVMLSTWLFLGEVLPVSRIVGICIICVGFVVCALPGK